MRIAGESILCVHPLMTGVMSPMRQQSKEGDGNLIDAAMSPDGLQSIFFRLLCCVVLYYVVL